MTVIVKTGTDNDELVAGMQHHKQQRAEQLRDSMPGKASQIKVDTVDNEDVRTFTEPLVVSVLVEYDIDVSGDYVTWWCPDDRRRRQVVSARRGKLIRLKWCQYWLWDGGLRYSKPTCQGVETVYVLTLLPFFEQ